jgi:hypothetical protein
MPRCVITRCRSQAFTHGACFKHTFEACREVVSALSAKKHSGGAKYAFDRALKKIAEKATIDYQWAKVSQQMIDRQLEVARKFPGVDFAQFAAECVIGPTGPRRKASFVKELRRISSVHSAHPDGLGYYKEIKSAIAHTARRNKSRGRWDCSKTSSSSERPISASVPARSSAERLHS